MTFVNVTSLVAPGYVGFVEKLAADVKSVLVLTTLAAVFVAPASKDKLNKYERTRRANVCAFTDVFFRGCSEGRGTTTGYLTPVLFMVPCVYESLRWTCSPIEFKRQQTDKFISKVIFYL